MNNAVLGTKIKYPHPIITLLCSWVVAAIIGYIFHICNKHPVQVTTSTVDSFPVMLHQVISLSPDGKHEAFCTSTGEGLCKNYFPGGSVLPLTLISAMGFKQTGEPGYAIYTYTFDLPQKPAPKKKSRYQRVITFKYRDTRITLSYLKGKPSFLPKGCSWETIDNSDPGRIFFEDPKSGARIDWPDYVCPLKQ